MILIIPFYCFIYIYVNINIKVFKFAMSNFHWVVSKLKKSNLTFVL